MSGALAIKGKVFGTKNLGGNFMSSQPCSKLSVVKHALRSFSAKQDGQGMTEYIILVLLIAVISIPILRMFPEAVRGYVQPFYYCISRPIP